MSLSGERLARAEARSQLARAQLKATAGRLRERLAPRQLADDIVVELRHAGQSSAERARRHPFAVAGAVALLSAVLLRGRLRKKATGTQPESLPSAHTQKRRARRSR